MKNQSLSINGSWQLLARNQGVMINHCSLGLFQSHQQSSKISPANQSCCRTLISPEVEATHTLNRAGLILLKTVDVIVKYPVTGITLASYQDPTPPLNPSIYAPYITNPPATYSICILHKTRIEIESVDVSV